MTNETGKLESYAEHEQTVAGRYKWWGVYLIREKRRLGGIAQAVQAEAAAKVTQTQASTRADWTLSGDQSVYFSSGEFGVYYGLVRLQTSSAPAHQNGVWD